MLSVPFRSFLLSILLMVSFSTLAEKTDIVFLKNGDRVTGEVKHLSRGKLEFKTDHMGTISIEWEDILEVVSTTGQAVELTNGQRFHGPLSKPENNEMVMIDTEMGAIGVNTMDIVEMYPVETGFWPVPVTAGCRFDRITTGLRLPRVWTLIMKYRLMVWPKPTWKQ